MFRSTCPKCNEKTLDVVEGRFSAVGMPLSEDGFSFTDAKQIHTEDERVVCSSCGWEGELAELYVDE